MKRNVSGEFNTIPYYDKVKESAAKKKRTA